MRCPWACSLLLLAVSAASARNFHDPPGAAANATAGTSRLPGLDESVYAWVVQTGRESAEEAVAAIMTTFLQPAAVRTGFVADVESTGRIRLADTGHEMERWSLARWEDAWPQNGVHSDSDAQSEPDTLTPQHHFYPHGAHKVLLGFNLMYSQWPEASWYIMIDDDTFVFRQKFATLMKGLDPEDKHYIGYPRRGAHMCRDFSSLRHRNHSEGPFALGGCGMILSRGAMKEFTRVVRGCTIRTQDCYLDDVRLFFCLRDVDIFLNTSIKYPAMNFAPNKNVDWGQIDPCEQPVVFHGVSLRCTCVSSACSATVHASWQSSTSAQFCYAGADVFNLQLYYAPIRMQVSTCSVGGPPCITNTAGDGTVTLPLSLPFYDMLAHAGTKASRNCCHDCSGYASTNSGSFQQGS